LFTLLALTEEGSLEARFSGCGLYLELARNGCGLYLEPARKRCGF
jgi:hypothetical protein